MNSVTFVNVSHPAEVQNHKVQTNIRRHVMRDIGRSRRKKARHKIVPMEFRALPENRNSTETPQITLQSQPLSIEGYNLRLYQSPEGSGILGMELDENAMQIVQFSKAFRKITDDITERVN
jgi:hypothetical protein